MKKALCLAVLFTIMFTGCGLAVMALSPPGGATPCTGDEECPVDYYCNTGLNACVGLNFDASSPDRFVTVVDASTDAVSADATPHDAGIQDTAVADTARADSSDASDASYDASTVDTTHAPDSMGHDVAVADSARADSSDAAVADARSEDAFVPECVERDTTCASLYGADHYCWQGRCVLANSSYCGPGSVYVIPATGFDDSRIRAYGITGFLREFRLPPGLHDTQPGDCSWLVFDTDAQFDYGITVFGQGALECSTTSCPPDGWRWRWDLFR